MPAVCQTVLNWPSAFTSPISTGLVMWWFGIIVEDPPVRFGTDMPIIASITFAGSTVPAFSHRLHPHVEADIVASIGSLVVRFGFLV